MPSDGSGDYDIGYRKPPIATRFKKGNNANPHGRPRGSKNMATILRDALNELAVEAEGKRRQLTKRELVIKRLVEKSAGADLAATKLLFDILHKADPGAVAADPAEAAPLGQDALESLKRRLARLARAQLMNPTADRSSKSDPPPDDGFDAGLGPPEPDPPDPA